MHQSREAHHPARPLHSPEGAAQLGRLSAPVEEALAVAPGATIEK